jgi:hypothetical protein
VKNEVGALATSIIYEPKAFSLAESGLKTQYKPKPRWLAGLRFIRLMQITA